MPTKAENHELWEIRPESQDNLLALAQKYIQARRDRGYVASTLTNYRLYIGRFLAWSRQRDQVFPNDITAETAEAYQTYVARRESKNGRELSDNSKLTHMRQPLIFFDWLVENDHALFNPFRQIRIAWKHRKPITDVLTISEVENILNQIDIDTPLGLRNRTILEVLYSTGIRAGELVRLTTRDLDLNRGLLIVVQGKNRKDRLVPIGDRAIAWVEKYLRQVRSAMALPEESALFVSQLGKAFSSAMTISSIATQCKKNAKITKKGATHIFRRTMATLMLENGADVRYIQEILGHESINTTNIYTKVTIEKIKQIHSAKHPAEQTPAPPEIPDIPPRAYSPVERRPFTTTRPLADLQPESPDDLIDLAHKYLDWMQGRYAHKTVYKRAHNLLPFLTWCRERSLLAPSEFTREAAERYTSHLSRSPNKHNGRALSPSTQAQLLTAVSLFCAWLVEHSHMLYNPTNHIKHPKVPRRLPRNILTAEEVEKIMIQPDTRTPIGIRDRAMLETFYSTGIRRSECAALRIEHISFETGSLKVVCGKGKKDRVIPIGERALDWIECYLQTARPCFDIDPDDTTLFCTSGGKPITAKGIGNFVRDYIKAADIGKTGACHLLRHTMATLLLENGVSIRHLQEILGHTKLDSTQIYTKVSIKKLKEVHNLTHPAKNEPTKNRDTPS